jgi:hypothetical protein
MPQGWGIKRAGKRRFHNYMLLKIGVEIQAGLEKNSHKEHKGTKKEGE